MTAPYVVHYPEGVAWGLIHYRSEQPRVWCFMCGRSIARSGSFYRCQKWGPTNTETAYSHQKCLIGQIDPTVWDIGIGSGRR